MEMRLFVTGRSEGSRPLMVAVALRPDECFLIRAQISSSGFHVCAAACSGVREGG